jgi:hypothetical protein
MFKEFIGYNSIIHEILVQFWRRIIFIRFCLSFEHKHLITKTIVFENGWLGMLKTILLLFFLAYIQSDNYVKN